MSPPNFEILFSFPNFIILNLKLFGNSRDNLYTEVIIQYIKFCFTCSKSNFHGKTGNCKDIMSLILERMDESVWSRKCKKLVVFSQGDNQGKH